MKQNYCKIALINGYIRAGNVLSWHRADVLTKLKVRWERKADILILFFATTSM